MSRRRVVLSRLDMGVTCRDGIESAAGEGMAAEQALEGEPAAAPEAVKRDGLGGVFGAGGEEATGGRQERGEEAPVEGDGGDDDSS